jgi:hypothetical protein
MPTRGYGSQVPNPGPLAAGGHVMADSIRVTSMPTPVTHPEHVQSALTWINLALVYQRQPTTDEDPPGTRTYPSAGHGRSLSR